MSFPVDAHTLALFIPAALALNLTPGPDMMFCLAQGLKAGPRAAVAANIGIALGCLAHTLAAGLGLAALLKAAPEAMTAIRLAGAAYLAWIAVQTWRAPLMGAQAPGEAAGSAAQAFRQGLVTNLLNPKVIIFIVSFLPQFVDPARGSVLAQFMILGTIIVIGGLLINGAAGLFAGRIGARLARSPSLERGLRRVSATIFGLLAARLVAAAR